MSSFARRLRDEETGASLILITLSLVVLMGFAAFAVDASAARSQRRENQGAADTAGLSAIQLARDKLQADAIADATQEVIRISYQSLFDTPPKPADPTFAEWQTAWATCADTTKPAEFTLTGSTDCVSFTAGLQKLRTRLPDINVDTTFGRVLGRNEIRTGGISVVAVEGNPGTGAILPFGLPGQAVGDPHVCLKTGPQPQSEDPCDGPNDGNFSFLDITQFGFDPNFNTSTICQGSISTVLARNIAQGIDHPLREAPFALAPDWLDRDLCNNESFQSRPYTLTTETGNAKGPALTDGLILGVPDVGFGRLTQAGGDETTIAGISGIDDVPLWDYLNGDGLALCEPYDLDDGSLDGDPGDHDWLIACLADNIDSNGEWTYLDAMMDPIVIFEEAVASTERFAWVPLFHDATLGNGNTDHNIDDFRPVYLQTTFWNCNPGGCAALHDPGEIPAVNGTPANPVVEAITGIQLPLDALPTSISVTGNPDSEAVFLYSLVE